MCERIPRDNCIRHCRRHPNCSFTNIATNNSPAIHFEDEEAQMTPKSLRTNQHGFHAQTDAVKPRPPRAPLLGGPFRMSGPPPPSVAVVSREEMLSILREQESRFRAERDRERRDRKKSALNCCIQLKRCGSIVIVHPSHLAVDQQHVKTVSVESMFTVLSN